MPVPLLSSILTTAHVGTQANFASPGPCLVTVLLHEGPGLLQGIHSAVHASSGNGRVEGWAGRVSKTVDAIFGSVGQQPVVVMLAGLGLSDGQAGRSFKLSHGLKNLHGGLHRLRCVPSSRPAKPHVPGNDHYRTSIRIEPFRPILNLKRSTHAIEQRSLWDGSHSFS